MNNDLNNSIHSEEPARENLGAGDRLRVEDGSGENHDVRGAEEMVAHPSTQKLTDKTKARTVGANDLLTDDPLTDLSLLLSSLYSGA